ncbi:conserved uncharacterized protein, DUF354 [Desulfosarcina variabilis str. Montpellier]
MEQKGHRFLITARDKDVAHSLLKNYQIPFFTRGKGKDNLFDKFFYMIKADLLLYKLSKNFKPDFFMSFSSPYAAQVAWFFKNPHIAFTDTETATLGNYATIPFSNVVCTPTCFKCDLGEKHICFDSYMELCYLSEKYFKPNPSALDMINIKNGETFTILRFVSWKANHDIGHKGLSMENKIKAVKEFSKFGKVFISSEEKLPDTIKKYQIRIPTDKMHDIIAFASLLYGESATMASECAVLGTPAIYIDNDGRGYTDEQEKNFKLVYNFTESLEDQERSIQKGIDLLSQKLLKKTWDFRRKKMLATKIDPTSFMVWLLENYPDSVRALKNNKDHFKKKVEVC